MIALNQFNSLEDAKAYEVITYKKINGNEATQIFSLLGALDSLEDNKMVQNLFYYPTDVDNVSFFKILNSKL